MTVTTAERAQENREYVRGLLAEKLPEFAAMLESAEQDVDQELSCQMPVALASLSRMHKGVRKPLRLDDRGSP